MRLLGYDHHWEAASKAFLVANPACAHPGCSAGSAVTDHIDGLGPLGPRGFDPANWQALCWSHHSRKTVLNDGGFGRQKRPQLLGV